MEENEEARDASSTSLGEARVDASSTSLEEGNGEAVHQDAQEICNQLVRNDPSFTLLRVFINHHNVDGMCRIFNALKQNTTIEKVEIASSLDHVTDLKYAGVRFSLSLFSKNIKTAPSLGKTVSRNSMWHAVLLCRLVAWIVARAS